MDADHYIPNTQEIGILRPPTVPHILIGGSLPVNNIPGGALPRSRQLGTVFKEQGASFPRERVQSVFGQRLPQRLTLRRRNKYG
jgi:hypothetical protein